MADFLDYTGGEKEQGAASALPAQQKFTFQDANLVRTRMNTLKDLVDALDGEVAGAAIRDKLDALLGGPLWRTGGSEFLGAYADLAALQAAHVTGSKDQYALVGTSPRTFYVWDLVQEAWTDSGVEPTGFGDMLKAEYVDAGGPGVVLAAKRLQDGDIQMRLENDLVRIYGTGDNEIRMDEEDITLRAGNLSFTINPEGWGLSSTNGAFAFSVPDRRFLISAILSLADYAATAVPSPSAAEAGDRILVVTAATGDVTVKTLPEADALAALADAAPETGNHAVTVQQGTVGFSALTDGQMPLTAADITALADGANWLANGQLRPAAFDALEATVHPGEWYVSIASGHMYWCIGGPAIVRMALAAGAAPDFAIGDMANLYWFILADERTDWTLDGSAIQNMVGLTGKQFPSQAVWAAATGESGSNVGFNGGDADEVTVANQFNRHIIQADTFDPFPVTPGTETPAPIAGTSGAFTLVAKFRKHGTLSEKNILVGTATGLQVRFGTSGVNLWVDQSSVATLACPTAENETEEHIYLVRRDGDDVVSVKRAQLTGTPAAWVWEDATTTHTSAAVLNYDNLRSNTGAEIAAVGVVNRFVSGSELDDLIEELENV